MKYIVDIHGEIEGDYEIIGEYKEPKKGEWIPQQEPNGDDYFKAYDIAGILTYATKYKCNKCGLIITCIEDHGIYDFCPHCGADMRGEE